MYITYYSSNINLLFYVQHYDKFVLLHNTHPIQVQNQLSVFHHENINCTLYRNEKTVISKHYIFSIYYLSYRKIYYRELL